MIYSRTLRGKLGIAYAIALLVALIAFAAVTLALVDRTQRSALDERLQIAARAIAAIVEGSHGRLIFDASDRAQFSRIVGNRVEGAIVDARGNIVISTLVAIPPAIRALAADRTRAHAETVRLGDEPVRVAILPVPVRKPALGVAIVWRDVDYIGDLDDRLALAFSLAIPAVAAFAAVAGGAVAMRGLRPLVTMASLASEIEARDLSRRLSIPPRDDELGRLVATFDRMLDRLESAFERQRRFTSDASHELRAPLSVIRAEADLALRHPRSREEYERALRAIAAQADDLERLTRDLLAVARADSAPRPNAEAVDLVRVADDAAERLGPLARSRGITVSTIADGAAAVRADADGLRRAISCVVHNALTFARPGGMVELRFEPGRDTVRLTVADDGPGFSAEALAHATERFWRDDAARTRRYDAAAGSGLGLAIATAIVSAAGGTLTLRNGVPRGAVVVLELPSLDPRSTGAS